MLKRHRFAHSIATSRGDRPCTVSLAQRARCNTSHKMMDAKGVEAFIMLRSCIRVYERVYTCGLVCAALKAKEIKRLERARKGLRGQKPVERGPEFTAVYGCFRLFTERPKLRKSRGLRQLRALRNGSGKTTKARATRN